MDYTLKDATKKDIEIINGIKLITMIDEEMDKKLTHTEKEKIKSKIEQEVKENYTNYKIIFVGKKIAGVYSAVPYQKGIMIDELYLFEEFKNKGIASSIINNIKNNNDFTYMWYYDKNTTLKELTKKEGFIEYKTNNRVSIVRYNNLYNRILELLNDYIIGYSDKKGNLYKNCYSNFNDLYTLQKPQDTMDKKIGLCFDQVEVERYLLSKHDIKFRTYYMLYQDSELGPAHSFVLYKENNKYYWLESSWLKYRGIHEYDTKEEAYLDITYKFSKTIDNFKRDRLKLYEYDKPRYGISYERFRNNAYEGKVIRLSRMLNI